RPGPCSSPKKSERRVLSGKPISQLRQGPKPPTRPGDPGRRLALPVVPGDSDLLRDRWRHVVKVALCGVEPASAADPLPRRSEVTWSRLVGADLLRGNEQREAHRQMLSRSR